MKTVVLLPTYNEAENLALMIEALLALPIDGLEVMIIDDNSPDGTGQIADELAAQSEGRVQVLHRAAKEGLGRAYQDGFVQALAQGADRIVQMDCDFSHPVDKLPEMVSKAAEYDVVIGSRYVKGGSLDTEWGWRRKLLSWWANRIYIWLILRAKTHDCTGGFRVWNRHVLEGIDRSQIRSNGYIFQAEMAYVTERLGYSVFEVPIHFAERKLGKSKMSLRIQIEAALRVWQVAWRHHALKPADRLAPATQQVQH
jgi:dolichol-phosphate mannosyltransferase